MAEQMQPVAEVKPREPKFGSRPAFTVVGMKLHIRGGPDSMNQVPTEIGKLWDRFHLRMGEIKVKGNPHVSYGVEGNYDGTTGEWDYLAGFEVAEPPEIPQGMDVWRVPAQFYVIFPCPMSAIRQTYDYIYQTWLPGSPYKHSGGVEFEYYDETFDASTPERAAASTFYAYVPVVAKE
ncbi:MAG: AraC family transcriptional regulator [Anaerolineae bacterium]|nr:AraC family transcriptional regulator [Anaerolineae bacterium]